MKKIIKKIWNFLFTVFFGVPLAFVLVIILLSILPFDYIRYKRSLFYKNEHKKYKLFEGSGDHFELYNEIARNGLPIKFIFNPEDDSVECGFFVFGDTLVVVNVFDFEYDFEKDRWLYVCEDINENGNEKRVIMSLDEYVETEIAEANRIVGEKICSKAVVLTDSDGLENIEKAEAEKRFLVYDGNRAEVLKVFCDV